MKAIMVLAVVGPIVALAAPAKSSKSLNHSYM